jgi:hypothetical protein
MRPLNRNTDRTLRNIVAKNESRLKLSSALEDICRETRTKKWTFEIREKLNSFTTLTIGDKLISNKEVHIFQGSYKINGNLFFKLICAVCAKRSLSFNGWMTSVILEGWKFEGESESGSVFAATPDCLKRYVM